MTRRISVRTYDTILFTQEEVGLSIDELRQLPWVRAGVGQVNSNRLGIEISIGAFAGRVVIPGKLVIDIDEIVPGTAAACLALSSVGRRQRAQASTASRLRLRPSQALADSFLAEAYRYLSAGPSRHYAQKLTLTRRPRGTILVRDTVAGPWARGRTDRLVCRHPHLTNDTPWNRVLLGSARRAEAVLANSEDAEASLLTDARQIQRQLAAVGKWRPSDLLACRVEAARNGTAHIVELCASLLEGVPALPRAQGIDSDAFSAWVAIDRVFEEAVRTTLALDAPAGSVTEGSAHRRHVIWRRPGDPPSSAKRADPDIVLVARPMTAVLDVKYRRSGEAVSDEALYQLLSHAGAFGARAAALVVPALSGPPTVRRLGRDAYGCAVDVISVDPTTPTGMRTVLHGWRSTIISTQRSDAPPPWEEPVED